MVKSILALACVALAAVGWQPRPERPTLQFAGERMNLEYAPQEDEAVLVASAESDTSLARVDVRGPLGESVLRMQAGDGQALGISGFQVETLESEASVLFLAFPEGVYDLRGRSVDGSIVHGSAVLSHELLPAPIVTYPSEGAANVPTSGLVVTWVADSQALGYRVILEQDDNDGLSVELPAGTDSFAVPDGILEAGKETLLEVAAIAPSRNSTLTEVAFTTL
jgi:hypothetical protein